jgi:hypothetical protein
MTYERFICSICGAEFSNPEELRLHRLNEHKGKSREKQPQKDSAPVPT